MKLHSISLINAFVLILIGLWAYLGVDEPSVTALIPVFLGVLIAIFNPGLRKHNKIAAHLVVSITLLAAVGLTKPLIGALSRADGWALFRVGSMLFTTLVAMVFFIRSFIIARR